MTDGTHETEESTEVAGRAEFALLGAVLSYSTTGHNKPFGQTIGANGCGDFSVLIKGAPDDAEDIARQYLKDLERDGYRITHAIITRNDELASYNGNPLKVLGT